MKPFTERQERGLLVLACFGFVVPNGLFLYHAITGPQALREALINPVARVFIGEAFLLLFLMTWVIRHLGFRSPGWRTFIALSLAGSLAFSVPIFLYLASRRARDGGGEPG